jgi:hypothetical protein
VDVNFYAELYLFRIPRQAAEVPCGMKVFWVVPWLQYGFFPGSQPHNKFVCAFCSDTLPSALTRFGIRDPHAHVRKNEKSYAERVRVQLPILSEADAGSGLKEFSISTVAALVWASSWAAGKMSKRLNADELPTNSQNVLCGILREAMCGKVVSVQPSEGRKLSIDNELIDVERFVELWPCLQRRIHLSLGDSVMKVSELLSYLAGLIWSTESRVVEQLVPAAREAFRAIASSIACAFEVKRWSASASDQSVFLNMPTLCGPKGKTRRVSMGKMLAIVRETSRDDTLTDPSQLIASERILKRSVGDASLTIHPKTAKRFRTSFLHGYHAKAITVLRLVNHLSVACDGVQACGMKLNIFAGLNCEA